MSVWSGPKPKLLCTCDPLKWDPLCEKHLPETEDQLRRTRSALWKKAHRLEEQAYALRLAYYRSLRDEE